MVALHLIADSSEILPAKKNRNSNKNGDKGDASSSSSEEEYEFNRLNVPKKNTAKPKTSVKATTSKKKKATKAPSKKLDKKKIKEILCNLEETFKSALPWIEESLTDAAEDMDEPSEDPEDGVPLVPFTAEQRTAIENAEFMALLRLIGFQEPSDTVSHF